MKVVLVLGPSGSGKSSLCRKLVENHRCKLADTDEFYDQAYPKAQDAVKRTIVSLSEEVRECLARYKLTDRLVNFPITGELYLDNGVKIGIESVHQESTTELLKQAGIAETDIPSLAACLRHIVEQSQTIKEVVLFRGLEPFFNAYLEHAFAQDFESDDTLVLDVNPHSEFGPAQILAAVRQRIQSYSDAHPEQSVDLFKVLAYCPPLEHSKRLRSREESGYAGNTARGLYSFEQLLLLVKAVPGDDNGAGVIDRLSLKDVGKIINNCIPEARKDLGIFTKARHEFARKFGFDAHVDTVQLVTSEEFPCDAIVNTNAANATDLAQTLIDKVHPGQRLSRQP